MQLWEVWSFFSLLWDHVYTFSFQYLDIEGWSLPSWCILYCALGLAQLVFHLNNKTVRCGDHCWLPQKSVIGGGLLCCIRLKINLYHLFKATPSLFFFAHNGMSIASVIYPFWWIDYQINTTVRVINESENC